MKTDRVGVFVIDAHAPILGGSADWTSQVAQLTFDVAISEVKTGNPLLDPEVHALVKKGSDGVLTYHGTGSADGDEVQFEGTAKAGDVEVPMAITGDVEGSGDDPRDLRLTGTATFSDVHIPLPGFGHVHEVKIHVVGVLQLTRPS
ncbi:MAG: hypothetical protein WCP28_02040 [Actinomycetes bacterium]